MHPFEDEVYFYKFTDDNEDAMVDRLEALLSEIDMPFVDNTGAMKPEWLSEVARSLEEDLKPKCHKFRLRVYNDTLVGSEIITFLVEEGLATTRGEALQLGRAVVNHFRLFEHVTLDHPLKDANVGSLYASRKCIRPRVLTYSGFDIPPQLLFCHAIVVTHTGIVQARQTQCAVRCVTLPQSSLRRTTPAKPLLCTPPTTSGRSA